jgi:hypothetical protein
MQAVQEGKNERYEHAQQILENAKQRILSSQTGADPFCQLYVLFFLSLICERLIRDFLRIFSKSVIS